MLVGVKGMSDEIIRGITSAGYDILRDVFTDTAPHLLQENEMLKKCSQTSHSKFFTSSKKFLN